MIPSHTTPEDLNVLSQNTLATSLGIVFTGLGEDWLEAEMPVDERTRQPYGVLHGGASAALAETLGSVGSHAIMAEKGIKIAGLEINANHIRSVRSGKVTGKAVLLHKGQSTHIWDIRIRNEENKLVCVSRLTVVLLSRES